MTAYRTLRWAYTSDDGLLFSGPGVLYTVRLTGLVTGSQEVLALIRDGVDVTGTPLVGLWSSGTLGPDDWPKTMVTAPFAKGLYVAFSGGTPTSRLLTVGWDVA